MRNITATNLRGQELGRPPAPPRCVPALVPLVLVSGDVSSGFQSGSGVCFIRIAEENVM